MIPDDLNLSFDDKGVVDCKAFQDFIELHEFLPSPVMLLLAKAMECVCKSKAYHWALLAVKEKIRDIASDTVVKMQIQ